MSAFLSRYSRTIFIVALGLCFGQALADLEPPVNPPSITTADQTPADFLDLVGQRAKARWRLLFRPPPPTPPTDRGRAALILGSLLGDSFLVWQAADSQQFRNNNQDVLTYCRMLGLGEKLMPRLMAQGKMAESNEWKELRHEIVDGHQELIRMLREQKDDDLALMIDLGLWLRVLEIASTIVVSSPEVELLPLCIGSPAILQDLRDNLNRISVAKREDVMVKRITSTVDAISAWGYVSKAPPTPAQAAKTNELLKALMQALMAK